MSNGFTATKKVLRGIEVLYKKPKVAQVLRECQVTQNIETLKGITQADADAVIAAISWQKKMSKWIEQRETRR